MTFDTIPDEPDALSGVALMKSIARLGAAAVFAAGALQANPAEARGSSTPAERARFVAMVRTLEKDPLAGNANATRQALRRWIVEVPDIRFKTCPDLLGQVLGENYPYFYELNTQVLLSGAVLTIEDPGKARDDAAVYTAGVDGALRVYEVLVTAKSDARLPALDQLIEKRERGELVDHIDRLATDKCPRSYTLLIAAPIGAAVGLVMALPVAYWFGRPGPGHGQRGRRGITTRTARISQGVVFICAAYYLIAGIALHFLEPEYDPRFQFMSDYVWGIYGWLMTTTFFVLGLAILTVALAIRNAHRQSKSVRVGFGLLVVGALFVSLAGVFRGFPLHDAASAVGILSLVMAALLLSWTFRHVPDLNVIHPATLLIAVGMCAAIVSMIADVGMPGLQQRAFLVFLLLWLSIVVHKLVRPI